MANNEPAEQTRTDNLPVCNRVITQKGPHQIPHELCVFF